MDNIVVYNNGELELKVSINDDTVWLNRHQISELFDRDVKTIDKHINNVFSDEELEKNSTVAKFAIVQKEGVNFRQWAKQLQLDLKKYNEQYLHVEIKKFNASHDRFLIIDDNEVYHIGASLKDLGKKWFGFSKMNSESFEMMGRLK